MADLQGIYSSLASARCTHQGCQNEPVMFVYSRLTKRSTPQCHQHGLDLLRRGAYEDLDRKMFDSSETEVS